MTRVLVDSDVLAYACGGATQKTRYDISAVDADGLLVDEAILNSMAEVKAWQAEVRMAHPLAEFSVPSRLVDAEPIENALHLVNLSLASIMDAMSTAGVRYDRLELFLTGKGNFRERIATIKGYKANRDRNERPVHYTAIREYLVERYGAVTVEGMEADDILSIIAHAESDVIVVSGDKDLKNVPGVNYNARTKTWTTITKQAALVHFYRQVLVGDQVDNIPGCFRAGPKLAETAITESMTEYQMYSRCLELYRASLGKTGCLYAHMSAEDVLLENARLLHLLRHHGDVWHPPSSLSALAGPSSTPSTLAPESTGASPSKGASRSRPSRARKRPTVPAGMSASTETLPSPTVAE